MFRKVLIANRGEIAVRVIRTCRKLGIKTVAVYSDPDLGSRHVSMANEAYNIGPGPSSESYLSIPKIIKIAKSSKVEAIHPGYGFLAENPEFARSCEEERIVFIGPSSRVLFSAANKFESRGTARKAGVPIIPGSRGQVETVEEAEAEARRLGFPVLIKASYGGGGRGMRIVNTLRELARAFALASAEAKSAFGRSDLYLEKNLRNPRHLEVQIIAGRKGRIIHLGERECSLQRRHQKILEETPSPVLAPTTRKRLISLALKATKSAKYENAGTVEFVRTEDGQLYYLEINKRIQVEHLITEMVTGVDIVERQLSVASGDGLGLSQEELSFNGAAINCRINAEDASQDFAPSPGKVEQFTPPSGPGIRVDTAMFDGAIIPEYYDSLIAKIAAQGSTREEAIRRLSGALVETVVNGVATTIPVHQTILEDKNFLHGDYHTQMLDLMISTRDFTPQLSREETVMLYLATRYTAALRVLPSEGQIRNNWRTMAQPISNTRSPLFVEGL